MKTERHSLISSFNIFDLRGSVFISVYVPKILNDPDTAALLRSKEEVKKVIPCIMIPFTASRGCM
jgi:hypothetical protein